MIVDLHNHTTLCNHAEGKSEEYIVEAINQKCKFFGFADHAPMDYDEKYRMSFDQMKAYEENILTLKSKYKNEIDILLAYEVDYLENHMDKRVLDADVDYLIGSVHFINKWGFDNPEFIGKYDEMDIDVIWQEYFDLIEKMAKSKYFNVVGHLDLIKVFKFLPKKNVADIAHNALIAIKEAGMAIELNVAGYRKPIAQAYPSKTLLDIAFSLDIPITFSSDAHKPSQINMFEDEVYKLARDVGYKECVYFEKKIMKYITF